MRSITILALAAVAFWSTPAPATAQRADSGEVVEYGIIKPMSKPKDVKDANISTGSYTNYDELEITDETSTIPAKDGVVFGTSVKISGSPRGETAKLKVVWIYPEPGLKNPDTGVTKMRDEFPGGHTLGSTQHYYWTLGEPWTRVLGKWTFQLWQGDRRLVQKTFELVRPK